MAVTPFGLRDYMRKCLERMGIDPEAEIERFRRLGRPTIRQERSDDDSCKKRAIGPDDQGRQPGAGQSAQHQGGQRAASGPGAGDLPGKEEKGAAQAIVRGNRL